MSEEQVNEATPIDGYSGPVNILNANITIVAGVDGESSSSANPQSSVESPSGATGTSTVPREKEEFQKLLRAAELQLAEGDRDSEIERIEEFLSKESRSAITLKYMADDLKRNGHNVQAMILYKVSHGLHKREGRFSPDAELRWIDDRIYDIYLVIRSLLDVGGTSRKIAVKFLKQFLEEIREVQDANPGWRARVEYRCLSYIALVHLHAGEYEECIRFGQEGLKIMTQQFGGNASKYRVYGILSHILAAAYLDSGRYSDAESCLAAAIESYSRALDYGDENERVDNIASAKRCLEETRRKNQKDPNQDPTHQTDLRRSPSRAGNYSPSPTSQGTNIVPSLSCSQRIGPGGGRIMVGDCFIEFQPGTFTEFKDIAITARIDNTEWPQEGVVITPTLDVKLGKIRKPAKVRLSTWVTPDRGQSPYVQIMHCADNEWKVIHTQQLEYSRYIEFQCDSFSRLLALLRSVGEAIGLLSPVKFTFLSRLFGHQQTLVTAFHLDDEIMSQHATKVQQENALEQKAFDTVKRIHNNAKECLVATAMPFHKGDEAEFCLECKTEGFTLDPSTSFVQPIDDWILSGQIRFQNYVIESDQETQGTVKTVIHYNAGIQGTKLNPSSVIYDWNSGYSRPMGLDKEPSAAGENRPPESCQQATVSIETVNFNGPSTFAPARDTIAGIINNEGTVNEEKHGGTIAIASSSQWKGNTQDTFN